MVDVMAVVPAAVRAENTVLPTPTDAQLKVPRPEIAAAVAPVNALFKITELVTVTVIPVLTVSVADAPVK